MFKKIFLTLVVIGLMAPVFVSAQNSNDPWGIKGAAENTQLIQTTQTIPEIIGTIIGVALSFVGIVFFLLILYAGFLWMTAFGNEEKVTTSKSIMEHAIIGLIIVLSAYAISKFVFNSLNIDNGPSPQGQIIDPFNTSSTEFGEACGDHSVWNFVGVCASECEVFLEGVCQRDNVDCLQGYQINLCPGAANIKCCPPPPL